MDDRGHLTTEHRHPRSMALDRFSTSQAFDLLNQEDATVARTVAAAREDICRAIDLIVVAFRKGGRLIYVGAGTSGRLGVLDAAECPPTFLSDPSMVQGIIAGGIEALTRSIEGAEDFAEDGAGAIDQMKIGECDVVFGIATGGTTPFVHGAILRAKHHGAKTVFLACVGKDEVDDDADVSIRINTGPEVLTGSTRMKAGTATKMVLNMISTIAMVRLGKVYQNLMVDVSTRSNAKLVDRGIRIVQEITNEPREAARALLDSADGQVKIALVMHAKKVDQHTAERLLAKHDGLLAAVIDSV